MWVMNKDDDNVDNVETLQKVLIKRQGSDQTDMAKEKKMVEEMQG